LLRRNWRLGELLPLRFRGTEVFSKTNLRVLLLVASGLMIYYFGKTKEDIDSTMRREIDQKLIDYQVVEGYKQRLQEIIRIYVNSSEVKSSIDEAVKSAAGQHVRTSVEEVLREKVAEEIKKTKASDVEDILKRALTEIGGIEARIATLQKQLEAVDTQQRVGGDNVARALAELQGRMLKLEVSLRLVTQSKDGQAVGTPTITGGGGGFAFEECGRNMCFDPAQGICRPGPCAGSPSRSF
jgi:hypothetical protein